MRFVALIKIRTDEGIVGWSDIETQPHIGKAIVEAPSGGAIGFASIRAALIGEDPLTGASIEGTAKLKPRLIRIVLQEYFAAYPDHGVFDWSQLAPYYRWVGRDRRQGAGDAQLEATGALSTGEPGHLAAQQCGGVAIGDL